MKKYKDFILEYSSYESISFRSAELIRNIFYDMGIDTAGYSTTSVIFKQYEDKDMCVSVDIRNKDIYEKYKKEIHKFFEKYDVYPDDYYQLKPSKGFEGRINLKIYLSYKDIQSILNDLKPNIKHSFSEEQLIELKSIIGVNKFNL